MSTERSREQRAPARAGVSAGGVVVARRRDDRDRADARGRRAEGARRCRRASVDGGRDARADRRARGARGDRRRGRRWSSSSATSATATGAAAGASPRACTSTSSRYVAGDRRRPRPRGRGRALDPAGEAPQALSYPGEREMVERALSAHRSGPVGSAAAVQVLNFYSTVFADQMKRGRKTATIRLGDKWHKYRKNQGVLVTVGYQYSPRERLFHAVIDNVEVKRVKDLSPARHRARQPRVPPHRGADALPRADLRPRGRRSTTPSRSCASRRSSRTPPIRDRAARRRRRPELSSCSNLRWHSRHESANELRYSPSAVGTLMVRVPKQ